MEKKAWRSTFQDGIWDIFFGLIFLGFGVAGLSALFDLPENQFFDIGTEIILIPWNIATVFFFYLGKKFITIPRLGFVKFGTKRKKTRKVIIIFLIVNVIFAFLLIILSFIGMSNLIQLNPLLDPLLIGLLIITLPLSILGFFLDFYRLIFYSLFAGLGFFLSELFYPITGEPFDLILSFCLIGSTIIIIGLIYLIKFLQKYPLSKN
ncbi:MAG: hypothetical protein ACFFD5_11675 [Candidatus Thorarchaeota archaeon]